MWYGKHTGEVQCHKHSFQWKLWSGSLTGVVAFPPSYKKYEGGRVGRKGDGEEGDMKKRDICPTVLYMPKKHLLHCQYKNQQHEYTFSASPPTCRSTQCSVVRVVVTPSHLVLKVSTMRSSPDILFFSLGNKKKLQGARSGQ